MHNQVRILAMTTSLGITWSPITEHLAESLETITEAPDRVHPASGSLPGDQQALQTATFPLAGPAESCHYSGTGTRGPELRHILHGGWIATLSSSCVAIHPACKMCLGSGPRVQALESRWEIWEEWGGTRTHTHRHKQFRTSPSGPLSRCPSRATGGDSGPRGDYVRCG